MAQARACGQAFPGFALALRFGQYALDVDGVGCHLELPIDIRPFLARAVAVDLDAVAVEVGDVEGFADQMVALAWEWQARCDPVAQPASQSGAAGHENGKVIEAGIAVAVVWEWLRAGLFGEEKQRRPWHAQGGGLLLLLKHGKTKREGVIFERVVQVCNRHRNKADLRFGGNGGALWLRGHRSSPMCLFA